MIECTRQELLNRGFQMGWGLICDALSAPDVYGFYKIGSDGNAFLTMKSLMGSDFYLPHRVKFSNGNELGEGELLCGNNEMSELEDVGALIKILERMDVEQ